MTLQKAVDLLRQYNEWRRYSGLVSKGPQQPDPTEIGMAIDTVVEHYDDLAKRITAGEVKRIIHAEGSIYDEYNNDTDAIIAAYPTEQDFYDEVVRRFYDTKFIIK